MLLRVLFLSLLALAPAHAEKPNFLLILTDDLGYGDVSAYQKTGAQTPSIDRLAAEGMLFTRMRANATVCSPTRAALLTGRYADRVGVPGVIRTYASNSWGYLAPGVPTIADRLRESGYHTALIGKWHLGLKSPNTPNERGFDLFHGFLGDMMDSYTTHERDGQNYMRRNAEVIQPTGHATDLFSDWSVDYLRERAADKKPFFLYLAYNAPHAPIEPPPEWLDRVKQRDPKLGSNRAKNIAFVEHLDDRIGRVLAAMKETGLDQNTIVVFTSDNGGALLHGQSNDPWRGGKQSHYEGGLRVPFIVRWPGTVAPGSKSDYAGLTFDAGATFLEVAGLSTPPEQDAVSLVPTLTGKDHSSATRELYFVRREGGPQYGGKSYEALIVGDWKLLQNSPYSPLELYNLKEDPEEQKNVLTEFPQIANKMRNALQRHIQRGGETPWQAGGTTR